MKKSLLAVLAVLGLSVSAHAQTFEALTNPNVVAGLSYLSKDPGEGFQRFNFFLTANVAGVRIAEGLYAGGAGVAGSTLDPNLSEFQFSVSLPILTYAIGGGQWVVQGGYAWVLTGEGDKPDGFYAGAGFSLTSPVAMKAKRAAKKAERERRELLAMLSQGGK